MRRPIKTTYLIFFWLCAFSFTGIGHSQNFVDAYEQLIKNHQGDLQNQKVDSLIAYAVNLDSVQTAIKLAHNHSIANYKLKEYERAIDFGLTEIALYEQLDIKNGSYIQVLYNIGRFYFKNQNYKESIAMHKKVVDVNFSEDTKGRSFFEIGNNYWNLGDFYKAIDNYKIGVLHLERSDNKSLLVRCYLNLSNRYEVLNTSESLSAKLEILERVVRLSTSTPLKYDTYATLYSSLASYYNNDATYDFRKSKEYQLKFLKLAKAQGDVADIGTSYSNLGNLYVYQRNDSAYFYFQRAIAIQEEPTDLMRTYNNLAHYYLIKSKWQDAINITHKSFEAALEKTLPFDAVPSTNALIEISDKSAMLYGFNYKVTAYIGLYEETNEQKYLKLAQQQLQAADQIIDLLQLETVEEDSKLYWREEATAIYGLGFYISYLADDVKNAFYFNEKNKALLLTEGVLKNADKLELPAHLIAKDLALKRNVLRLERAFEVTDNEADQRQFQEELFDMKFVYESFQDSLALEYPRYGAYKEITKLILLDDAQAALADDTVVVSYMLDETNLLLPISFAMSITNNSVDVIPLAPIKKWKERALMYTNTISTPFETGASVENFRNNAFLLYNELFPTEKLQKQIQNKKVVIVPDGLLQRFPLEALVTSEETLTYLIESSQIHYVYSLSFNNYNDSFERFAEEDFIGYGLRDFNYGALVELESTKAELDAIGNQVGGEQRFGLNATRADFLEDVNKYKTIHLATHADAGKYPWVAFHDAKLETHDLYTLSNQAELIVLSACNSSMGELAKGEGVYSLSRGFFYAGAHSVVSTFWNVNDKVTARLMEKFYTNLKQGKSKSTALHLAKLDYLKSNSVSDASPYYWASFVLIGDADTIIFTSKETLLPWLGLCLGLCFIGWLLYRFVRR